MIRLIDKYLEKGLHECVASAHCMPIGENYGIGVYGTHECSCAHGNGDGTISGTGFRFLIILS